MIVYQLFDGKKLVLPRKLTQLLLCSFFSGKTRVFGGFPEFLAISIKTLGKNQLKA